MEKLTQKERYWYNKYQKCKTMALAFYIGMCISGALLIVSSLILYLK